MASQMTKWRKVLWWVGVQPIFTGGFLGPKKAHLVGINRYDDCTLRNVGYFGELVWNPLVLALEFMPRKQGCHTKPCPYNLKNQPLAAPALSKQLPNQEKLFPAVAETFQQSINHWAAIVAKKLDPGILDPSRCSGQIRKVEARLGKLAKIRKVETN